MFLNTLGGLKSFDNINRDEVCVVELAVVARTPEIEGVKKPQSTAAVGKSLMVAELATSGPIYGPGHCRYRSETWSNKKWDCSS